MDKLDDCMSYMTLYCIKDFISRFIDKDERTFKIEFKLGSNIKYGYYNPSAYYRKIILIIKDYKTNTFIIINKCHCCKKNIDKYLSIVYDNVGKTEETYDMFVKYKLFNEFPCLIDITKYLIVKKGYNVFKVEKKLK